MRPAAFAIPGDHRQKTGGFIYERRLLEELRAAGRDVAHLMLPASYPAPSEGEARAAAESLRALSSDRPLILDGLVFGAIDTGVLASLACPVIAMVHHPLGLETGLPPARAAHLLAREAANLRHVAHVVVPSAHTARVLVADFGLDPSLVTVAPPGHDGPRGRRPLGTEQPLILSVGLLARRKGHDVLIRALSRIADLDWVAEIVGKTHEVQVRDELRSLVDELGLRSRVLLAGEVEDADLARRYREARIFTLATRYEGYGMALAEALAAGLPIVTCRAGAVPDTVGSAALLVPPDSPEALAGALRDLLTDDTLRTELATRAEAAGLRLPTWSDTAAIMGTVLDQVEAGPNGAARRTTGRTCP
ncbi:glycosyltransferase family 4 protein [Rubellimicrobium arenae]|uniref:glycosyltransferase family 4 protein n=1 Tax=Rubellimicrobium arenae TaxID=2817372 RepID=UPI001B3075E0|nr:glycosyltransferase family 4 protein [Rubellimicrobium arenae]